jgi:hypothetical protein
MAPAPVRPFHRPGLEEARLLHPLSLCAERRGAGLPGAAAPVRGGGTRLRGRPCRDRGAWGRSGHSTRFLARAVGDGGLATRITCIDPAPRATLAKLPVEHVPALLRDADAAWFDTLAAGDILFIDSSHIAMPGTDVDRLFLDVLPRLAAGVLVHVHDVTLPEAYPAEWAWRGYNEQLLVGALLQGGGYDLVFASHYAKGAFQPSIARGVLSRLPLSAGAHETSLWLRKR